MPLKNIVPIDSSSIMRKSRTDLQGKWGPAIGAFVIYFVITIAISFIPFVSFLTTGAFSLGLAIFSLNMVNGGPGKIEDIFEGFKNFGNAFLAYLLMVVFVVLWSLLLVIPGIIAAFSYSQTFFIMAEDKNISGIDAISKSKEMMKGYKMEYFIMNIKFFGLSLLALLTFGIAFFWLLPYMYICMANFYKDLKGDTEELNLEDNLIL